MSNFFGITDELLFKKGVVKIIEGVAGSAKSSNIDRIFKDYGIEYGRYTSTNVLKRDAEKRYGCKAYTIAGGLFKTIEGVFYKETKEVEFDHIIIDEILQAGSKVYDWVRNNYKEKNIIITTDSKQMLVDDGGANICEYEKLKKEAFVEVIELKKTYRARTPETEEMYYELYRKVDDGSVNMFDRKKDMFKTISFDDLDFNKNDIFICHTNEIEKAVYDKFELYTNRLLDYVQKGNIASKESVDYENYPIMCQVDVMRSKQVRSYLQAANVASATRFQGSEVKTSQKLYYLVEKDSYISNREFYTVLSRCYDMNSIVIVVCDLSRKEMLSEYFGKKILKYAIYDISEMFIMDDGRCLSDWIEDYKAIPKKERPKKMLVTTEQFEKMYKEAVAMTDVYWETDFIKCDKTIIGPGLDDEDTVKSNMPKNTKYTLLSQITKEGDFQLDYVDEIYRILEEHGAYEICYAHSTNASHDRKKECMYELDLYSAYPHIMMIEKMPVKGNIYHEYTPGKLNFFRYTKRRGLITYGAIISDNMVDYLQSLGEGENIEFLFATDFKQGSNIGKFLHDKAHRSIETKAELKELRYGMLQKKYMQQVEAGTCGGLVSEGTYWEKPGQFVRNSQHVYELVMAQICSELCYIMMCIQDELVGAGMNSTIITDAVHFEAYGLDVDETIEKVCRMFDGYDFRIIEKDGENETVIGQTYKELLNRKQIEAEREKNRRKSKKNAAKS